MSPLRLLRHLCPPSATRAMSAAAGTGSGADLSVVYVTAPSDEVARRLATLLVQERRLAACVNIVPAVTSVYEWEGEVHHDNEVLLIIKARAESVPELAAAVRQSHPYDCPEVLALPVLGGSEPYLQWVRDTVRPKQP
ncbi:divalent-cation tolerance protein CutA-like [Amphibalanus amphitrite]|uniref:divalent-cation tolerance protein CutA-like n=1 Tax=Amphibalanus amphitrite TaxID=1232801 RepID=UPI001C926FFB|nr:divalent-cation tolerance protein CutA-like [Amphibalanus amphitrite]